MKTVKTFENASSFTESGIALAVNENKTTAKRSTTFCGVGRSLFACGATIDDVNALADGFRSRYLAPTKQALNEILQYIVKGYNAESAKSGVLPVAVIHCYSTKQNEAARFTFNAKPAKEPKQKTASGNSDAPIISPLDKDTLNTEQKASLIADVKSPYTEHALMAALSDGSLSMATLKKAIARFESKVASKAVAKEANKAQSAIDKELQALMAAC